MQFPPSELILTDQDEVYHLGLKKEHLRNTIITVGDPDRVDMISELCDEVIYHKQVREFNTKVVRLGHKEMMVISTGIGTDNIDIVINELDALANIDFASRSSVKEKQSLEIIRIGTSGTLRPEIPVHTVLSSRYGLGLGGLMHFYDYEERHASLTNKTNVVLQNLDIPVTTYSARSSQKLTDRYSSLFALEGITVTAPGFYGPQGRNLNAKIKNNQLLEHLSALSFDGTYVTNFEMETAGILGLCQVLGHHGLSLNLILANRATNEFSTNASGHMKKLLEDFLKVV